MGLLSGGLSMAQELLAIRYISPPWAQTATLHKGQRDKGGGWVGAEWGEGDPRPTALRRWYLPPGPPPPRLPRAGATQVWARRHLTETSPALARPTRHARKVPPLVFGSQAGPRLPATMRPTGSKVARGEPVLRWLGTFVSLGSQEGKAHIVSRLASPTA